jgi:hypothetical protein
VVERGHPLHRGRFFMAVGVNLAEHGPLFFGLADLVVRDDLTVRRSIAPKPSEQRFDVIGFGHGVSQSG